MVVAALEEVAVVEVEVVIRRSCTSLEYMVEVFRATYSVDGEEYEGTVVNKNVGNKSVTVRFHGYNNEEEVAKIHEHIK